MQVGAAAVPAVHLRLLQARDSAAQLALVEVLAAIGAHLPARGRVDLIFDLAIIRGRAADDSARQAIDGAIATLRRLNERDASPTTSGRPADRP